MKHEVIKTFRDKETGVIHDIGSSYESTDGERVSYLESKGFVKSNKKASTLKKAETKAEEKVKSSTRKKASE